MSKAYYSECPCRDCSKRTLGCHDKCTDYKNWQKDSCEIPPKAWIGYSHLKQKKHKGKYLNAEVD